MKYDKNSTATEVGKWASQEHTQTVIIELNIKAQSHTAVSHQLLYGFKRNESSHEKVVVLCSCAACKSAHTFVMPFSAK